METVRIRFVFEDRHILSKSQKSEGLKRSWLLLKPQHETISDLSSYLIHIFDLDRSCPNGLLLSMDGFVLPPFESTCILKDKDIIRVKKKEGTLSDIITVGDGAKLIEEVEIVDKQPVLSGVLLLANEEFEKETGGYQSEPKEEEDNHSEDTLDVENSSGGNAASKKRKASKKLQSSKKKKKRPMAPEAVEDDFRIEEIESPHHDRILTRKSVHKKEKVSDLKSKPDIASTLENAEKNNKIVDSMPSAKSCGQLQENGTCSVDVSHKPDGTRKSPSRSARRKKAKRQWLRELTRAEKKELNERQSAEKDVHKNSGGRKGLMTLFPNQNSDAEDEIVPVEIRPGHIRFEPLGQGKAVQKIQVPVETFQWNGISSKKKGQKWGKEKFSSFRRNDYKDFDKECSDMPTIEKETAVNDPIEFDKFTPSTSLPKWNGIPSEQKGQKWGKEKFPSFRRNDYKDFDKECSDMPTIEKETAVNDPIDFDKLTPSTSLPKEGDVIAYRLLELSSSWTPELSSFRVGKTSLYDPESNRVVLIPVPEYPSVFEKEDDGDASSQQPDKSPYREDGSLEIDFSSLVDVRIVEHGDSDPAKTVTGRVNEVPVGNKDVVSGVVPKNSDNQTDTPTPEKKEVNMWDEISQALSAKKAQLSQENGWSKENSGRSSWSYRALRSSALGPTMAVLRARNDI